MLKKFIDSMNSVLSLFPDSSDQEYPSSYRSEQTSFRRRKRLSSSSSVELYLKSNLLQRVIETIPELALDANIVINSDSEDNIDKEQLQKRFKDWDIKTKLFHATISARIYKESYLILDVDDQTVSTQPIDWNKCKGLKNITFVEFENLEIIWNKQETERIFYKISDSEIKIHPDRVLLFTGKSLSPKTQALTGGANSSQLEGTVESYNLYVSSLNEGSHLLSRLVTFVLKMGGLKDFLENHADGISTIQTRLKEHKRSIGGFGGLCIDKDSEEVEWISYSLSGVSEVINKSENFFIASTELTHDMVMNEGSNSTSSLLEDKNTQRKINSFIRLNWAENLNKLCQIIACGYVASSKDILFTLELPEQSMSQLETVQSRYTQAQSDNIYYQMGVLNQETLQESRFASSNPWEIVLVNPGNFETPAEKMTNLTSENQNNIDQKENLNSESTPKKESKITDSINAIKDDYQLTKDNLEEILTRVQSQNPLVFAFIEAEQDNEKDPN